MSNMSGKAIGISFVTSLIFMLFFLDAPLADCSKEELRNYLRQNQSNINSLQPGMTKDQVMGKMGNFTCKWLINPWKVEPLFSKGHSRYMVIYYVTHGKRAFNPVKPKDLTPLVFKDDVLIGWGYGFLNSLKQKI